MSNVFGIDLGTTNSAVVWHDAHRGFRTIGDPLDNNPTPSVVAIERFTQQVEFGRAAKQQWLELLESGEYHLIESVKSCLDKDDIWSAGYGRFWTPEGIASELFRFLSQCSMRATGKKIERAVVAVPIGMGAVKRAVLRSAARAAGVEILTLVSEPTAACIAHLDEIRHCRHVAVFDWGGGTLDISVLELRGNCLTELHTIPWGKAGDDIDQHFAEWLHQRIALEKGLKKSFDDIGQESGRSKQLLVNTAEECKRKLQEKREAIIQLGDYAGMRVRRTVTREEFNTLVKPVVVEAVDLLFDCVKNAGITPEKVGCLLLVGGSSKLLALEQELQLRWPQPNILKPPDAEWDIAKGAAILALNPGNYRLAEDIGLQLADGSFYTIFPAATKLEQAQSKLSFGLVEDSRTASFILKTQKQETAQSQRLGELHAETFGFRDEIIELKSRITEDLIFEAVARSDKQLGDSQPFTHTELRWRYELPNVALGGINR